MARACVCCADLARSSDRDLPHVDHGSVKAARAGSGSLKCNLNITNESCLRRADLARRGDRDVHLVGEHAVVEAARAAAQAVQGAQHLLRPGQLLGQAQDGAVGRGQLRAGARSRSRESRCRAALARWWLQIVLLLQT